MTTVSREYSLVLSCLRADPTEADLGRVREAAVGVDWDRVAELACWHAVEPLVCASLHAAGIDVVEGAREALRAATASAAVRGLRLRDRTLALTRALATADIDVVLLKGAALVDLVYVNPGLRAMADTDLLVHDADLERAEDVVRRLGYSPRAGGLARSAAGLCHGTELVNADDTVIIELHRHLFDGIDLPDLAPLWARSRPAGDRAERYRLPAFEDLVFHVAAHFASDRLSRSEESLRQLVDIAEIVRVAAGSMDWDVVVGEARRFDRAEAVFFALHTARTLLDVPIPDDTVAAVRPSGYSDQLGRRFIEGRVLATHAKGPVELLANRRRAARGAIRRLSPRSAAQALRSVATELRRPRAVVADARLNRLLDAGGRVKRRGQPVEIVRATGTSMGSSIREGDWLFLSEPRTRLGDVAVVDDAGRLIAHRVVGTSPLRLVGDARLVAHDATRDAVRGRVVAIVRGGRRQDLTGVGARVTGFGHVARHRVRVLRQRIQTTIKEG